MQQTTMIKNVASFAVLHRNPYCFFRVGICVCAAIVLVSRNGNGIVCLSILIVLRVCVVWQTRYETRTVQQKDYALCAGKAYASTSKYFVEPSSFPAHCGENNKFQIISLSESQTVYFDFIEKVEELQLKHQHFCSSLRRRRRSRSARLASSCDDTQQ